MNKPKKSSRSDRNRQAIAGLRKHYANGPSLAIDGVSYTPADIERILQDSIDAADATTAAAAAFHKAVAAEKAASAKGDPLYRGLRTLLIHQYKTAPNTLADFGITLQPKRQVPNAANVADAVVKRDATRKARHTMGKRQKADIKGQVAPNVPAPTQQQPIAVTPPVKLA